MGLLLLFSPSSPLFSVLLASTRGTKKAAKAPQSLPSIGRAEAAFYCQNMIEAVIFIAHGVVGYGINTVGNV